VVICNSRYRVHGDPPSQRSAEDIAFSVARFFSKGGNLVNYYMVFLSTSKSCCINMTCDHILFFDSISYSMCNFCSITVEQTLVEPVLPLPQLVITMRLLLMNMVYRENQNGAIWGMCTKLCSFAGRLSLVAIPL